MFFLTLCLLFIIRLRFPTGKSIAETPYFSFIVFPHFLLNWNHFNGHLITFWMFIVPLQQHLLHLLIATCHTSHFSQMFEDVRVKFNLILSSSHPSPHLISTVVKGGHLPPPQINDNNQYSRMAIRLNIFWFLANNSKTNLK